MGSFTPDHTTHARTNHYLPPIFTQGPITPSVSWQELLGLPPINLNPNTHQTMSGAGTGGVGIGGDGGEKLNRELFLGNTEETMDSNAIKAFLEQNMRMVGLDMEEKWGLGGTVPLIKSCRLTGKFAFLEMRSCEEAANCLNLNGIPYENKNLALKRPSKYTGVITTHGDWDDILAKVMSGEIVVKGQGQQAAVAAIGDGGGGSVGVGVQQEENETKTNVLQLTHMVTTEDLANETEFAEILEETADEANTFGKVVKVVIPRAGEYATKIFIEFDGEESCAKAKLNLGGRTFDGNVVGATYFSVVEYEGKVKGLA